jgi:UDP-GlcNAc:undecaprenyl-phosphate GlcNAc-1-phosphate transferase
MPAPVAAFGLTFGIAFGLSLILTPLARWLGERGGLVARPGGRRQHAGDVSRLGGLPIYAAFITAVLVSQAMVIDPGAGEPGPLVIIRFDPEEVIRLTGLVAGGTIIFLVGVFDDWRELSPLAQYIAQVLVAGLAIAFLIIIEYVNNPFTGEQTPYFPYIVTVVITLFWLGLMMNTVNWLDGLDGLATGVVALACVVLFINAAYRLSPPQYSVALLPLALLGATLGFLPFNFAPARIFLGSSGAYFLGFTLGALSIIGGAKMAAILLVMGLPLLDVAWQIVNRVLHGRNPTQGDRGHLHFRLLDLGLSHRQIVIGYYVFCAIFGGLTLVISSRLYKLLALVVMAAIAAIGFFWLSRRTGSEE